MAAIALLLLVITSSLVITRVAAAMLEMTGMSRDSARFQARAAYCGVGWASSEAEGVTTHPVRRQIVSLLMLLGNAGTATAVATLILSFTGDEAQSLYEKMIVLAFGLLMLLAVSSSSWVDRQMSRIVQWALRKYTRLDLNDYTALLNLASGYSVAEFEVTAGDWLAGRNLRELALPKEGVLVLGIRASDGSYVGAPTGTTAIRVGDVLTLYGKLDRLEELNRRRMDVSGVYARAAAISERAQEAATHTQ